MNCLTQFLLSMEIMPLTYINGMIRKFIKDTIQGNFYWKVIIRFISHYLLVDLYSINIIY